ncbi:hypothetical protein HK405_013360, partial [Cladochytrium tenue]
ANDELMVPGVADPAPSVEPRREEPFEKNGLEDKKERAADENDAAESGSGEAALRWSDGADDVEIVIGLVWPLGAG